MLFLAQVLKIVKKKQASTEATIHTPHVFPGGGSGA
jgi:hypothetical protein